MGGVGCGGPPRLARRCCLLRRRGGAGGRETGLLIRGGRRFLCLSCGLLPMAVMDRPWSCRPVCRWWNLLVAYVLHACCCAGEYTVGEELGTCCISVSLCVSTAVTALAAPGWAPTSHGAVTYGSPRCGAWEVRARQHQPTVRVLLSLFLVDAVALPSHPQAGAVLVWCIMPRIRIGRRWRWPSRPCTSGDAGRSATGT